MKLNSLLKIKKNRKTVGRGGGRGGTSGKGNKGQKARSGGFVKAQFEGGQTPLTRRIPRRGFNNKIFKINYVTISLEKIFNLSQELNISIINKQVLFENEALKNTRDKVKVLFGRRMENLDIYKNISLDLTIDACSGTVEQFVTSGGGKVIFC